MIFQRPDASGRRYSSGSYTIAVDTWYKVTVRAVRNTTDYPTANGIIQVWVDDVLRINASDVRYTRDSNGDLGNGWDSMAFDPVFGGNTADTKPATDYFWTDYTRIQTTSFGGDTDQSPPYVDSFSPADGATGVAQSTTSISWRVKDSGDGVNNTTVTVACSSPSIATKTCGDANFSCTGTTANYLATLSGLSLSYDQAVSCTLNASDLASPVNAMGAYTYNFTVQSDPTPDLTITTTTLPNGTEGTAYSQTLAATGGQTPYTWSLSSGSLPTGVSLSSAGVISGVPTIAGTNTFTVQAQDSAGVPDTDTQDLTLIINPAAPTGQTTVIITDIADTYINSGYTGTNYSDNAAIRVYQFPFATTSNRILDNISLTSLPANIEITAATLEMYLYDYDSSGGTNPMRVYVYPVTATNIESVTWSNFAGTIGAALSYTDVSLVSGWFSFSVLEAVQSAYTAGTPLYLALDGGSGGAQDTNRYFASMDHATTAWRPRLKVTYTQQVGPPPSVSVATAGKMKIRSGKFRRF